MNAWIISHVDQLIQLGIGILAVLAGMGAIPVSKNPQANADFVKKWGKLVVVCGVVLAAIAVVLMVARSPR